MRIGFSQRRKKGRATASRLAVKQCARLSALKFLFHANVGRCPTLVCSGLSALAARRDAVALPFLRLARTLALHPVNPVNPVPKNSAPLRLCESQKQIHSPRANPANPVNPVKKNSAPLRLCENKIRSAFYVDIGHSLLDIGHSLPLPPSVIPSFRYSVIPLFRYSVIPSFRHSVIPPT